MLRGDGRGDDGREGGADAVGAEAGPELVSGEQHVDVAEEREDRLEVPRAVVVAADLATGDEELVRRPGAGDRARC